MIEKTRKSLGVSQAQLGRACGISRQMISDLEMGCYLAAPELAARLRSELQSPGLSDQSHILPYREIQQLARLRPFELPPVNQEPWQRMHRFRSELVARIGLPSELAQWIENHLSCDSGGEGIGIFSTAAAGARPGPVPPSVVTAIIVFWICSDVLWGRGCSLVFFGNTRSSNASSGLRRFY